MLYRLNPKELIKFNERTKHGVTVKLRKIANGGMFVEDRYAAINSLRFLAAFEPEQVDSDIRKVAVLRATRDNIPEIRAVARELLRMIDILRPDIKAKQNASTHPAC